MSTRSIIGRAIERVWLTALAGCVTTSVCWGVLMLEVGHQGQLPVFELNQASAVVR